MAHVAVLRHFTEIMDDRARTLADLKGVLDEVGSEHALIGGLAVGYHGRPRATIDVDLLVPRSGFAALGQALEARGYILQTTPDMMRVFALGTDEAVADLFAREANPLLREAAKEVEPAVVLGHQVNLVRRGALVALKFHAAVSPKRRIEDRYQDVADLGRVVAKKFDKQDAALARRLAELAYPGAGADLDRVVDDLRNDRPVKL